MDNGPMTLTEAYGPPMGYGHPPIPLTAYRYAYRHLGYGSEPHTDTRTISDWHFIPHVRFDTSPHVEVWKP